MMETKTSGRKLLQALNIDNHMGYCYYKDDLAFLDRVEKEVLIDVLSSESNEMKMDRNIYMYEDIEAEERKLTSDVEIVKERFLETLKYFYSINGSNTITLRVFLEFLMYGYNLDMINYLYKNFKIDSKKISIIVDSLLTQSNIYINCNAFDYKDFPNSALVKELLDEIYEKASEEEIETFFVNSMSKITNNSSYIPIHSSMASKMIKNSESRKYIKDLLFSCHSLFKNKKESLDIIEIFTNPDIMSLNEEEIIKTLEIFILNEKNITLYSKSNGELYNNAFSLIIEALLNPYTYTEEGRAKLNYYLSGSLKSHSLSGLFLSPVYEKTSFEVFLKLIEFTRYYSNYNGLLFLGEIDTKDKKTLYSRAQNTEEYVFLNSIDIDDFILGYFNQGDFFENYLEGYKSYFQVTKVNKTRKLIKGKKNAEFLEW